MIRATFLRCAAAGLLLFVGSADFSLAEDPLAFQCTVHAGVPPVARADGRAERIGDIVLDCFGGTPTAPGNRVPSADVSVYLNTNVTSRLLDGWRGEPLLLLGEPGPSDQYPCTVAPPGACYNFAGQFLGSGAPGTLTTPGANKNVFQGTYLYPNTIRFSGIPIDPPPATGHLYLRLVNIRADATQIGPGSSLMPGQITATVSLSGSIPVHDPVQNAAFVAANGTAVVEPAQTAGYSYEVELKETSWNFFQVRNIGTSPTTPLALDDQNEPGMIYNTETGFYASGFPDANGLNTAGLADHGTRLMVTFDNIPPGTLVYTSITPIDSSPDLIARRVDTDATGAGPYLETLPTNPTPAPGIAPVAMNGARGYAVYEVIGENVISREWFRIGVVIEGDGTPLIRARLAPVSDDNHASATAPLPRFGDFYLPAREARSGDFDNDGSLDLVWQDTSTGEAYYDSTWILENPVPGWKIVSLADLDGDGFTDLVLQEESTGRVGALYLFGEQGNVPTSWEWITAIGTSGWSVVTLADFNRDRHPDILWQEKSTHRLFAWYLGGERGTEVQFSGWILNHSVPGWSVVGTTDLNTDGYPDLLWQEESTRRLAAWYMGGNRGSAFQHMEWLADTPMPGWRAVGGYQESLSTLSFVYLYWQEETTGHVIRWTMSGDLGNEFQNESPVNSPDTPDWRCIVP